MSKLREKKCIEYQVGDKIRIYFNPGNRNNRTYTIRAFVDDQVVVKMSRNNHYLIWSLIFFNEMRPYMNKVRSSKEGKSA